MAITHIKTPFNFIIFGASGDLAKLKLFPSLYELALQKRFPKQYRIMGYGRSALKDEAFRKIVLTSIKDKFGKQMDKKRVDEFVKHFFYQQGQYDNLDDYQHLAKALLDQHGGKAVKNIAYLAVPPSIFKPIIERMAGIRTLLGGDLQLILEKPFGSNEETATDLFHFVSRFFGEDDIFLLDHYLGKVSVQSVLPLRYANTILDILLKGENIANIQITALESVGVDKRISYFESVGIVKDMIQSHLLQVLSLFVMAMPIKQDSKSIRREKINILSALRYEDDACGMVLGQYKTYQKEKGVKKGSTTPTFAAIRFFIDLLDWYQVSIYIRTGKKLNHKHTYVVVEFKKPAFQQKGKKFDSNKLIIELYPEEKIQMRMLNEEGKDVSSYRQISVSESLACVGDECLPEHGRLILNAFMGDHTNFLSFEEIIACWKFIDNLMECAEKRNLKPAEYANGSGGPNAQHELTGRDNFKWYDADYS